MGAGQRAGGLGVAESDWQLFEPLARYNFTQSADQAAGKRQFATPMLRAESAQVVS